MTRNLIIKSPKFVFGLAILCVALWPKSAFADAVDVVTYNFSGTAVCIGATGGQTALPCGSVAVGASASITGTFQFDPDTESLGAFSFSLPNAVSVSGTGGTVHELLTGEPSVDTGFDYFIFDDSANPNNTVTMIFGDTADSGVIVPHGGPIGVADINSQVNEVTTSGGQALFNFSEGSATPATTPVPEPSSLMLLGTGLLGLAPFIRRRVRIS